MTDLKNIEVRGDGKVLLHLKDRNPITLGELHGSTLVLERNPSKHLMRQWNAYGINAELIDSDMVEHIVVCEPEKQELTISVTDIKAHARYYKKDEEPAQYFIDRNLMTNLT